MMMAAILKIHGSGLMEQRWKVSESCFNENGYLLTNTTKDGCTVNGDGAWTVNGVVQTQGQQVTTNLVQNTDDQGYPLKGRIEKYFCHEESAGLA